MPRQTPPKPSADNEATVIVPADDAALLAAHDELAGAEWSGDDDGLAEVDAEDIRIATYALNAKRLDDKGRQIPADVFFDTLQESTRESVDAVFLTLHKTNLWSTYDEAEQRSEIHCRSQDRVTGTLASGVQRPCKGCSDAEWYFDEGKQKRMRRCGPVYNVVSLDKRLQQLFVIRFKRTALPVIKTHLQKHHIGRRLYKGRHVNYPLYAFNVRLSGKMAGPKATHALPIVERSSVVTSAELQLYADAVATLNAQTQQLLDQVERQDVEGGGSDDTSFDPNKWSNEADDGKNFVVDGGAAT